MIRHPRESGEPELQATSLVALDPRFRGDDELALNSPQGRLQNPRRLLKAVAFPEGVGP